MVNQSMGLVPYEEHLYVSKVKFTMSKGLVPKDESLFDASIKWKDQSRIPLGLKAQTFVSENICQTPRSTP